MRNVMNNIQHIGNILLSYLYPSRCVICDDIMLGIHSDCCPECKKYLHPITHTYCMKCGRKLDNEQEEYCRICKKTLYAFDQGMAAFSYEGPVRNSVFRMKYANRRDYVDWAAAQISSRIADQMPYWKIDLIVPVPMHVIKQRRRGYNQAKLLAKAVGKRLQKAVDLELIQCVRYTRDQKTLGLKERKKNLKNAFAVKKDTVKGKNILVIDDVCTTGSTMHEIASVLKRAGAAHVYFAVICIVP